MLSTRSPVRRMARPACVLLQRSLGTTPRRCADMNVGELQGAKFRIEPLRRVGEDDQTKRARLLYQSRKRGILESDLVLSTFAAEYLPTMTTGELDQYDLFLDENDWDIYYWATQREPNSSTNPSVTESPASASSTPGFSAKQGAGGGEGADCGEPDRPRPQGEWAQTVGTFKPAYRPVPARWQNSEVLEKLRRHVRSRSGSGGLGFMPFLDS